MNKSEGLAAGQWSNVMISSNRLMTGTVSVWHSQSHVSPRRREWSSAHKLGPDSELLSSCAVYS